MFMFNFMIFFAFVCCVCLVLSCTDLHAPFVRSETNFIQPEQ